MMKTISWRVARHASRSRSINLRFASSQAPTNNHADPLAHMSPIVLRDACKCSLCVDQSTKQREFLFSDIPNNIKASAKQIPEGGLEVKWTNDIPGYEEHVSLFKNAKLRDLHKPPRLDYRPTTMIWDKATYERENASIGYDEYMKEDTGLAKALWRFRKHGLVFLTGVPSEPESVARIAERIAPLRNTFYGNTWNVRSVPQAKNVAYTSKYLGFHMDLLYLRESPGAQFLHCLENNSTGGESRFADTFKAYDILLTESPEHANILKNTLIRYEYDNDGYYYTNLKPVVQFASHDTVPRSRMQGHTGSRKRPPPPLHRIYWSPPFVGSIVGHAGEQAEHIARKVEATKLFADILERQDVVYETKMDEGTCVIFDNLRVVHARNAFDMNSGKRWLRGCYLDSQDVISKEFSLKDEILNLESKG